jgi:coenzyme F420-dependent glucose-6-phosphate dehydrogenase
MGVKVHEKERALTLIGYHASHEQFSPGELLLYVQLAEQAGFQTTMCSDHFYPWSERQGQSGYAWSWLGAAMQAAHTLPFGVVCAPGQRYHPAIIAQAAATLAEMFPDRFWLALGSGQLLNEHITGTRWLSKGERNARLKECVDIIRALWAGETVTHKGEYVTMIDAKLYTRPATPPKIIGAALTNETAEWVGGWADGIITTMKPRDQQQQFIERFYRGGGEGKPMYLQAQHSYAKDEQTALEGAYDQWRTNILSSSVSTDLPTPAHFDALADLVTRDEVRAKLRISADLNEHIDWIHEYIELGFSSIYIHNLNRDQRPFIEAYGDRVLPHFAGQSEVTR